MNRRNRTIWNSLCYGLSAIILLYIAFSATDARSEENFLGLGADEISFEMSLCVNINAFISGSMETPGAIYQQQMVWWLEALAGWNNWSMQRAANYSMRTANYWDENAPVPTLAEALEMADLCIVKREEIENIAID